MCRLAGAAQALLELEDDPARILNAINAHLCDRMPAGRFVTLLILSLDVTSHRFSVANAGHLPPMQRRVDGGIEEIPWEASGIPVGIDASETYRSVEGPWAPVSRSFSIRTV